MIVRKLQERVRLGPYQVIAKIGEGGMGTVYLTKLDGPVGFNKLAVVKELRADLADARPLVEMFLNEVRLAARLTHPNVVHTYGASEEHGSLYFAMEYLDGQPWSRIRRALWRSKSLPFGLHVKVLAEVLAGLHYAHALHDFDGSALGVVHCDVSPQNVFVTYDGQVKVVDFGVACAVNDERRDGGGNMLVGKLGYIAPEQARGEALDRRADVFAVGVMLWEAIAGHRFVDGDDQRALRARRIVGAEPRIREVVPSVPPKLAAICDRALALEPSERFATAGEFREALLAYLGEDVHDADHVRLGELVVQAFRDDRRLVHALIERHLSSPSRSVPIERPVLPSEHRHSDAPSRSISSELAGGATEHHLSTPPSRSMSIESASASRSRPNDPVSASQKLNQASRSMPMDPGSASRELNQGSRSRPLEPASASREVKPVSRSRSLEPASASREVSPVSRSRSLDPVNASREANSTSRSLPIDPTGAPRELNPSSRSMSIEPVSASRELNRSSRSLPMELASVFSAEPAEHTIRADLSELASVSRLPDEAAVRSATSSIRLEPQHARAPSWVGIAGALLLSAVWLWSRPSESDGSIRIVQLPAAAAPAAPPAPRLPSPAPALARTRGRLEIRLSARPADARFVLDGVPLRGNPYVARLPADGELHVLRAVGPGLQSQERVLAFDRDREVAFQLSRLPVVARADRARSQRRAPAAVSGGREVQGARGGKRETAESRPRRRPIYDEDPWR